MNIYDRLLQFTLFQGMSSTELMQVTGHTKFDFVKLAAGKRLLREGDACTHLVFLATGTISIESQSDDHSCRVVEQVSAPYTLPPELLFGLRQRHTATYKALTPCSLIRIDKQEVLLLLDTQLVFRLNMLNALATEAQRLRHHAWRQAPASVRERLTRFFFLRSHYPAGPKCFYILMRQLADELHASRDDISRALNQMQADQLVQLHRGRIDIPSLERLLMQ